MRIEGRVWKFGDDVDTDLIIPARYINVSDPDVLAKTCFIDIAPEFASAVAPGDVIVAGKNFGCGSSREHAPLAIKAAGVGVVVAKSFARIFYRNAFNIGLPLVESEEAWDGIAAGEKVVVDLTNGRVESLDKKKTFPARPIPEFMHRLIEDGGLIPHIRKIQKLAR
ncbi:MAG TPA: 3-isopropylmalate dehydratase small subunit [Syntrophales bacterium]|nr:3-isopropylmalate dehydratase small subunit [Syntrophobacterales bacterium]HRT71371.1 3-isopropylmalate dehydratase small subunit [Syntrophales bacterium]